VDFRVLDREHKLRPAIEQRMQRAFCLDARKSMAEAKVNSRAESKMMVRVPGEIQLLGILVRGPIYVGGRPVRITAAAE
jgi:hypothetical protein